MVNEDVIFLITENSSEHGVHETVEDSKRRVFCKVKSVKRTEYYTALNAGHAPELVFEMPFKDDYQGERLLEYKGVKYNIIRTYETDADGIELTAEREDVNTDGEDEDDGDDADDDNG